VAEEKKTRRPDKRVLSWDVDSTVEEADRKLAEEESSRE